MQRTPNSKKSEQPISVLQTSRVESPVSRYKKTESIEQVIMQLEHTYQPMPDIDSSVAAPADSTPHSDFNIVPTIDRSFGELYGEENHKRKRKRTLQHYKRAFDFATQNNIDIMHDHYQLIKLPEFACFKQEYTQRPVLLTSLHVPLSHEHDVTRVKDSEHDSYYAVVSESQRRIFIDQLGLDPDRIFAIHNGIDPEQFTFQTEKSDYLLFLGRINQDKGVHTACKAARDAQKPLVISGYVDNQPQNQAYFNEHVLPYVDVSEDLSNLPATEYQEALEQLLTQNPSSTIYVGRSDAAQRTVLYSNAQAFLFTSGMENNWQEPFGLVHLEANASGTPVVAHDNGAVPEIIVEGKNGLVADNYTQLINLIGEAQRLDPAACREHVETNFTAERTANSYKRLYQELLQRQQPTAQYRL